MTNAKEIVTNPDGSINTAFYMARGRRMRSEQARHLGVAAVSVPPKATTSVLSGLLGALLRRKSDA